MNGFSIEKKVWLAVNYLLLILHFCHIWLFAEFLAQLFAMGLSPALFCPCRTALLSWRFPYIFDTSQVFMVNGNAKETLTWLICSFRSPCLLFSDSASCSCLCFGGCRYSNCSSEVGPQLLCNQRSGGVFVLSLCSFEFSVGRKALS